MVHNLCLLHAAGRLAHLFCQNNCPRVLAHFGESTRENFTERNIYIVTQHLIPSWHKTQELNDLTWKLLYVLTGLSDAVVLKWLPWMTSADNCPVAEL